MILTMFKNVKHLLSLTVALKKKQRQGFRERMNEEYSLYFAMNKRASNAVFGLFQGQLIILSLFALLTGCRGQVSKEPPVVPIRNMYNQPRYDPQEYSAFFEDGRTMRPLVEGTVAKEMEVSLDVMSGRSLDNTEWVAEIPRFVVTRLGGDEAMVRRGHDRYNIYCAPCHAFSGNAKSPVVKRAVYRGASALQPPSFHDDRIRHMPDGQLYATITNGIRNMPAYRHSIPQDDRWAIVSYVRALQLSQLQATNGN